MESEGLLEAIQTATTNMLEEGLQVASRQTSTAGGPFDLLGVDSDGRLVEFHPSHNSRSPIDDWTILPAMGSRQAGRF